MHRPHWHIDEGGIARDARGEWVALSDIPCGATFIDYRNVLPINFRDGRHGDRVLRDRRVIIKPMWDVMHG